MRVLVLEDERPAQALLAEALASWPGEVEVAAVLDSVGAAEAWLARSPAPDLILSDIQLADGLAIELFEGGAPCPVVFVTAYDSYLVDAFRCSGIDYVLKPIETARVHEALARFERLEHHFAGRIEALASQLGTEGHRRRIVVRRGVDYVVLAVDDVAWVTTEHKLTFVVDRAGQRYLHDRPLGTLAAELDPERFLRLNRRYVAQVDAVARYRSAGRGRIAVELQPEPDGEVIVSQDNAARFRAWIDR